MKYFSIVVVILLFFNSAFATHKCSSNSMPLFTEDQLPQVKAWAVGGAFYYFAEKAGYFFDREAYIKDCPNWALFGFAKATGTACLHDDLMMGYISAFWAFNNIELKLSDPENNLGYTFKEYYDKWAYKLGFDIYLTKLPLSN